MKSEFQSLDSKFNDQVPIFEYSGILSKEVRKEKLEKIETIIDENKNRKRITLIVLDLLEFHQKLRSYDKEKIDLKIWRDVDEFYLVYFSTFIDTYYATHVEMFLDYVNKLDTSDLKWFFRVLLGGPPNISLDKPGYEYNLLSVSMSVEKILYHIDYNKNGSGNIPVRLYVKANKKK